MRRRLVALGLLLGGLFGAGLALAGSASAHASVVTSDPVDRSRLKSAPAVITITFDEPVGLGSIGYLHVTDQNGRRVDAGGAYHPNGDGTKIADNLRSGLGDGTYIESFRVISADSHPVAGTIRFVVGNGALSAAPASASSTVDHATSVVFDVVRWISYAGLVLLGGAWLILTAWPAGREDRRARTIVWSGLGALALGAAAELLLQGPYTAGAGLSDVTSWSLLDGTLHTDYGHYHSVRLVLLGLVALLLNWALNWTASRTRGRSLSASIAALLAGGVALSFSAVGHAATTSPDALSVAADLVHISAMAVWVGGLVMLAAAVLPRRDPDELRLVLPVASRVAFVAVLVMAVTGTYAAWRGIGTVHAVFATTYGLLVMLKVALFIGLVLLGNLARRALQPVAMERVRRTVLVEVALAVGVLVATSVLVAQPRGKEALAIAHQRPASATAALGGGRRVTVTIEPGTHGTVTAAVALSEGVQPRQVSATAALPSKQLGPIPLGLTANGADLYGASGVVLPAAGDWVITLVVTTSEFDATTTDVTVHLY
jgi:copper transport protein